MPIELRPHQQDALERMFNGCILFGGVGCGKTLTAVAYYMKVEADADVYVITTARKRDSLDWEDEFVKFGVGRKLGATVAGTLTVDSWHNISKYTDVRDAFFIFDEQKLVGAGEWTRAFLEIAKANRWILLTATPGDTWLDYIPVFLAHGFYKNRTDFKRRHVVYSNFTKFPKVERYMDVGVLVRLRNKLLVHMPYARHTTRQLEVLEVAYDEELFDKVLNKRWHVYEDRPLRDVGEMFIVMRKVVNSDPSRLEEVRRLWEIHPKLIVFYNFDYELEKLRSFASCLKTSTEPLESSSKTSSGPSTIASGSGLRNSASDTQSVAVAEWNGHKHEPVPTTDRWLYLVQYQAGAEAWNCVETDIEVFYSLTYSYKIWEQAMGRIDRMNTEFTKLHYKILKSRSLIDDAVWKAVSNKENFNEAAIRGNL